MTRYLNKISHAEIAEIVLPTISLISATPKIGRAVATHGQTAEISANRLSGFIRWGCGPGGPQTLRVYVFGDYI